ncbi:hypothetical protein [Clavibacter sp. VKM Ac-2872]|uniref:hypothetical protein n=1 Tax=Clavibacter sp. VKM Ac-2872 TaxID=2783812 RepID=UPI00188CD0D6|nr:hypothetical protein [Clavibacter sp. VKM Ac-2872]MBF4625868.1 hypothetical protein [Clavibacter sp. VKM Ac-2872]
MSEWRSTEDLAAALTFDVSGCDAAANEARAARAAEVLAAYSAALERAYLAAAGSSVDPWWPEPFGARIVLEARGDLDVATSSPEFEAEVQKGMNLHARDVLVNDEDGCRWEVFEASAEQLEQVVPACTRIRDVLRTARHMSVDITPEGAPC